MNQSRLLELLGNFNCKPPATEAEIEAFEHPSHIVLPEDYKAFLRVANGAAGFLGKNYISLWPVGDLLEFNRRYEVQDNAPGLLLIGTTGAGEAYAFDLRTGQMPVVSVPFVGLDLAEAIPAANSFDSLIENLSWK